MDHVQGGIAPYSASSDLYCSTIVLVNRSSSIAATRWHVKPRSRAAERAPHSERSLGAFRLYLEQTRPPARDGNVYDL